MAMIEYIGVDKIFPHPKNPRKDLGDLQELADSIRGNGVLQNLTVVPNEDGTTYTVIIGHRRLAAAKLAGEDEVPCHVAKMTPQQQIETMLIENMQRSDLTVYEQAQGFQTMLDLGSSVQSIAHRTGFSETTVRRRLEMAKLNKDTLREVSARQISLGDFDELAQIEDMQTRNEVLESIGTPDFRHKVVSALREQNTAKNLPAVQAYLKEHKIKKISRSETWSNKFTRAGHDIWIDKLGEADNVLPERPAAFYALDGRVLSFFNATKRAPREKKSEEQIRREQAIRDAWTRLDEAAQTAYELRKAFAEKTAGTAKNRGTVLRGAIAAVLQHRFSYCAPDTEMINGVLGLETGYEPKKLEKAVRALAELPEARLPTLVYALFGDSADNLPRALTSRQVFPRYDEARGEKPALVYGWLEELGYEKSAEEAALLDGRFEGYHIEED